MSSRGGCQCHVSNAAIRCCASHEANFSAFQLDFVNTETSLCALGQNSCEPLHRSVDFVKMTESIAMWLLLLR